MPRPPFDPFAVKPHHFVLDDERNVVGPVDLMTWARWFEGGGGNNRHVGDTNTELYRISTVFLGLDHRMGFGKGPPLLFETMVFELAESKSPLIDLPVHEELDGYCRRYASWDDALAGHNATLKRVKRLEADAAAKAARKVKHAKPDTEKTPRD